MSQHKLATYLSAQGPRAGLVIDDTIFDLAAARRHLILTGTPAGVGLARKEFLQAGDVVKVWVEGVGTLTNRCAQIGANASSRT